MKRILIVDDNFAVLGRMRDLVRLLLEELDKGVVEILAVTSGEEALGIATDSDIDLLITDFSMPDLNGLQLIDRLRGRLEIKKILLTFNEIDFKDRTKFLKKGVDEVLLKPVDEGRLKEILERFL